MTRTDSELRFDGRVAVVTGAGGQKPNLGEAYARLLASRGARVVVNDLGVGPDGRGILAANAEAIAREIAEAGGEAIADTHSVADSGSAKAVVQTALDAWGRIDILINNAGVVMFVLFEEISDADCELIVGTHLLGSIWMCRAAWPHMKNAGYGRIVNISSRSMFGNAYLSVYGAAKAGIVGLTSGLALEGSRCGINVNVVAPDAATRKHPYLMGLDAAPQKVNAAGSEYSVDQVAPVVSYLCHESCTLNGKFLWAGGGNVREFVVFETPGVCNRGQTVEEVQDSLAAIVDRAGASEYPLIGPESFDRIKRRPYVPR
jgi:NAD(P)-dependent dehydrogenase (short-subunit alcohol dehydrogenase family)